MRKTPAIPVIMLCAFCSAHGQDGRRAGSRLEERFKQLDHNGDGALSAREARRLPQFKEIDTDNSGSVTPDELRAWYRKRRQNRQQPDGLDGEPPEGAGDSRNMFGLAYIHKGSLAQASALVDVFGDGHPDILISCKRRVYLVRNKGNGSFAHAETYNVDNANGWGAHDFNGDGRLDAFVAQQQREQDDCWINSGNGKFTRRNLGNETVGNTRNVLFVGAVTRRNSRRPEDTRSVALYENVSEPGKIRFIDQTKKSGFGRHNEMSPDQRWQVNFASGAAFDCDNDGWVDLCLVNRRDMDRTRWPYPHLFRNTGKGTFVEVPPERHGIGGGAGGRDLNYGDLDGDGRIDVIIHDGTVGGYDGQDNSRIYMNRAQNDNHWIALNVVRGSKNTPAIGARAIVYEAGTQTILGSDEVRTDFCYRSKRLPALHFGLGRMDRIDIRVALPGTEPLTIKGMAPDRMYTLNLGDAEGRFSIQAASAAETQPVPAKPGVVPYPDIRYANTKGVPPRFQSLDIYTAMSVPSHGARRASAASVPPYGARRASAASVPSHGARRASAASAPSHGARRASAASNDQDEARPVVVMIHGGGWRNGDKANRSMTQDKVPHFVKNGYVYVSINCRLSAEPDDPKHPAHVQDCAKAIAWVHDNIAKYGGGPDRIFLMGHSAGAHLAALVSIDHRRLEAEGKKLRIIKGTVCLDTAAYDIPRYIRELGGGRGMRQLYENAFGTSEADWKDASPRHHVAPDKGIPPILFFHTGRRMAGAQLSKELVAALKDAGVPARAIHAADKDHAGINRCIGQPDDPYTKVIMAFLAKPDRVDKLTPDSP